MGGASVFYPSRSMYPKITGNATVDPLDGILPSGSNGGIYDFTIADNLFADLAGTVPIAGPGNAVKSFRPSKGTASLMVDDAGMGGNPCQFSANGYLIPNAVAGNIAYNSTAVDGGFSNQNYTLFFTQLGPQSGTIDFLEFLTGGVRVANDRLGRGTVDQQNVGYIDTGAGTTELQTQLNRGQFNVSRASFPIEYINSFAVVVTAGAAKFYSNGNAVANFVNPVTPANFGNNTKVRIVPLAGSTTNACRGFAFCDAPMTDLSVKKLHAYFMESAR